MIIRWMSAPIVDFLERRKRSTISYRKSVGRNIRFFLIIWCLNVVTALQ